MYNESEQEIMLAMNETGDEIDWNEVFIFDAQYVQLLFLIIYSIVFCICFFGNILVLLALSLHWKLKLTTKFCIANLCMADLCVGFFCVYQNLSSYLIQSWMLGVYICKTYQFVNALSLTSSVLILVVISIERYLAIIHPLQCRQILTMRRLRQINAVLWVASFLYSTPRFYYMTTIEVPRKEGGTEVVCTASKTRFDYKAFDMINAIVMFLLPLTVMGVLYTRIGYILWRTTPVDETVSTAPRRRLREAPANPDEFLALQEFALNKSATSRAEEEDEIIVLDRPPSRCSRRQGLSSGSHSYDSDAGHSTHRQFGSMDEAEPDSMSPGFSHDDDYDSDRSSDSYVSVQESISEASNRTKRRRIWASYCKCCHCFTTARRTRREEDLSEPKSISLRGDDDLERLDPTQSEGQSYEPEGVEMIARQHAHMSPRQLKSRKCVIRMLVVIVVSFGLLNSPYHIRKIVLYWWPHLLQTDVVWSALSIPFTNLCMFIQSAANPIIFTFLSSSFREAVRELFRCRWRQNIPSNDDGQETPNPDHQPEDSAV